MATVQDPSDDPNRKKIAEETLIGIVTGSITTFFYAISSMEIRQKLVAEHEKGYLGTGDKLPAAAQDAVPVLLIEIVTDTRPPRHAASSRLRIQRRSHKLLMARPSAASRAAWIVRYHPEANIPLTILGSGVTAINSNLDSDLVCALTTPWAQAPEPIPSVPTDGSGHCSWANQQQLAV
ncbi:hypothetical protein EJB05_28428 [Eragrostis curvula]|uniref:Uncharacterized protein n=1 Tax=Eragrostis curvula TaxID=38414 RepID=A0A5J9URE7_9POAL|nr:hypothetical protein EJB05_28428 [Eragrostis curvula]